ncbi:MULTISPECIES: hypothetical protein [unclassified Pseudoalteromonas]|uniref:hypothetical protein n=1 Tax=unclassified Pseudoalteromonas TaxID=194690 RepID=UPI000CF687E7|nr:MULTISPECIES: hypothetical protein [unclassified Pseudoalteromonas]
MLKTNTLFIGEFIFKFSLPPNGQGSQKMGPVPALYFVRAGELLRASHVTMADFTAYAAVKCGKRV